MGAHHKKTSSFSRRATVLIGSLIIANIVIWTMAAVLHV